MATTSADLLAMFNAPAPENQVVVDARILIPELEAATLTVTAAEISAPEARTWGEKSFMSSQLSVTFLVDNEEAREATLQDEPRLFHHVRINCTPEGGFDWSNNIDLVKFFVTLGVKVYEGKGKARVYVDNPIVWAADAVGRSLTGKIVQEPVKAKDEETGEWTSYKLDAEGEVVLKNKLSAFASLV
jgi:hypothetical protein